MATVYIQLAPITQMCLNSTLSDVNMFLIQSYRAKFVIYLREVKCCHRIFLITSTGATDIIESVAKCTTRVTEREGLGR